VKYYCEACERLVPPASFRIEAGLLVVKCSRCKVETRTGPESDAEPTPAATSKSNSKASDSPVIALAGAEAEPDPIENEPTRRISVPAEILAAIDAEEAKGALKKTPASMPVITRPLMQEPPVAAKAPAPEPAPTKSPAPEPLAAKAPPSSSSSSRMVMSEAAAANLVVLRLSEVKGRTASEPTPLPIEPPPSRPSTTQLRVVERPAPTPAPVSSSGASASATTGDPFMPPPGYCPKCIGVWRDGAVVCPFCGLEYARFRGEDFEPSTALYSTWQGVWQLWESKSAHDKVLSLASERGELALLGRLYRIRQAYFPDDPMAKRGREEVLRLASAGSGLMPSEKPDKRTKMKTAMLGVVFFVLLIIAGMVAMKAREMLLRP
jgi:hypothetical protein